MEVNPGRDEFLDLARLHPVVPVTARILADRETPVSAYQKLVGDGPGFLLESVEGGEQWGRWSFLGWDPLFTLVARSGKVTVEGEDSPAVDVDWDGTPLEILQRVLSSLSAPDLEGLPPLHSGLVGYLGYDCVRYIEHLPDKPVDDRGLPEMLWHAAGSLAAYDRFSEVVTLVRNVRPGPDPGADWEAAVAALDESSRRLGASAPYRPRPAPRMTAVLDGQYESTMDQPRFEAAVRSAKDYIRQGDAFQIVVSQRLATGYGGSPFDVYRALRLINPSPFLFYVSHPEVAVAGSSPELMTRVRDGVVYSRPIAGTRRRGSSPAEDQALEEEMLADPKELAEHVMLVDLARNDVGRVSEYGTVTVDELMAVERYSHVMHIVSGVSGKLRPGIGPVDVLRATFPHGTVSGAPKVRAMEIIDCLEPVARGPYAGAVGYLDLSGNVDTAICLRTVVMAKGTAWVQAGAGIVADSEPSAEYDETMSKAAAALTALRLAGDVG
jgi:anthranilate synthase component 1